RAITRQPPELQVRVIRKCFVNRLAAVPWGVVDYQHGPLVPIRRVRSGDVSQVGSERLLHPPRLALAVFLAPFGLSRVFAWNAAVTRLTTAKTYNRCLQSYVPTTWRRSHAASAGAV